MVSTEDEIVCTIVDEYEGRVTKPVIHTVLYVYERKLSNTETPQYQTPYEFVKSSWGVTAGRLDEDIDELVATDILYEETDIDAHPSTSYTVDYRSEFERILSDVPSDMRTRLQKACDTVATAESVFEVVEEFPEIEDAEKYQRVTPFNSRRATRQ